MPHLFSPLTLRRTQLRNRIVLAAYPSGHATPRGQTTEPMVDYYRERAAGGVGLVLVEPALALPPVAPQPHLAAYGDAFLPGLRRLATAIADEGAVPLLSLGATIKAQGLSLAQLVSLRDAYIAAARRAHSAGMIGVMLPLADGSPLHQLVSPRHNQRDDEYGGDLDGRLRLALETVEGIRRALGPASVIGLRLAVEDAQEGSRSHNDSRVIARRLVAAGASLIDVTVEPQGSAPLARFPGWRVPLAASLKPLVDVPVMVGGGLDDPLLADSVVRDRSVDLVVVGRALHQDPLWPQQAMHAIAVEQLDLGLGE